MIVSDVKMLMNMEGWDNCGIEPKLFQKGTKKCLGYPKTVKNAQLILVSMIKHTYSVDY